MTKPDLASLEKTIDKAFDERDGVNTATRGEIRDAVEQSLILLDRGEARVAEKQADGNWQVNQWLKKAVLLSFRLRWKSSRAAPASHHGGTRYRPSSTAGLPMSSKRPASALCPTASCATRPILRRTLS